MRQQTRVLAEAESHGNQGGPAILLPLVHHCFHTTRLCPNYRHQVEERQLPDCQQACCGGVVPGVFVAPESDPLALDYRAEQDADCQYFDYRRQEVRIAVARQLD